MERIPETAAPLAGLEEQPVRYRAKPFVPDGHVVLETRQIVTDQTTYGHRFRWLANKHCQRLNDELDLPFYRYEVMDAAKLYGKNEKKATRWLVIAMQNVIAQVSPCPMTLCPGHAAAAGVRRCGLGASPCYFESL